MLLTFHNHGCENRTRFKFQGENVGHAVSLLWNLSFKVKQCIERIIVWNTFRNVCFASPKGKLGDNLSSAAALLLSGFSCSRRTVSFYWTALL